MRDCGRLCGVAIRGATRHPQASAQRRSNIQLDSPHTTYKRKVLGPRRKGDREPGRCPTNDDSSVAEAEEFQQQAAAQQAAALLVQRFSPPGISGVNVNPISTADTLNRFGVQRRKPQSPKRVIRTSHTLKPYATSMPQRACLRATSIPSEPLEPHRPCLNV